jgi:hypothetical protein
VPITEIMIDKTYGYEKIYFMDGLFGYNQIKIEIGPSRVFFDLFVLFLFFVYPPFSGQNMVNTS